MTTTLQEQKMTTTLQERKMTKEQREEIEAAVRSAMSTLSFADAQKIRGNLAGFTQEIATVAQKPRPDPVPMPREGEIFTLSLGADTIDPSDILREEGWGNHVGVKDWQPRTRVVGPQTAKFRLVRAYGTNICNLETFKQAVGGNMAEAEWCEAFRKQYPCPPTKPPISEDTIIGFCGSDFGKPDKDDREVFVSLISRGHTLIHSGVWQRRVERYKGNCIMFELWLWLQRVE